MKWAPNNYLRQFKGGFDFTDILVELVCHTFRIGAEHSGLVAAGNYAVSIADSLLYPRFGKVNWHTRFNLDADSLDFRVCLHQGPTKIDVAPIVITGLQIHSIAKTLCKNCGRKCRKCNCKK